MIRRLVLLALAAAVVTVVAVSAAGFDVHGPSIMSERTSCLVDTEGLSATGGSITCNEVSP